ncbi:MAG: hypothetical protein IIX06_02005 [Bacteroidales bacterium]|nr:hypothetical protein [Bacteroidales bacterium]
MNIICLFIGAFIGFFAGAICNAAKDPRRVHYGRVHTAYRLLVDARDTGNIEEIANVAEEAIGYLGMALE